MEEVVVGGGKCWGLGTELYKNCRKSSMVGEMCWVLFCWLG